MSAPKSFFCRSFYGKVGSTVTYDGCDVGKTMIRNGIFSVQEAGAWHLTFSAIVTTQGSGNYALKMQKKSSEKEETISSIRGCAIKSEPGV